LMCPGNGKGQTFKEKNTQKNILSIQKNISTYNIISLNKKEP